jgi:hypothetical protein
LLIDLLLILKVSAHRRAKGRLPAFHSRGALDPIALLVAEVSDQTCFGEVSRNPRGL